MHGILTAVFAAFLAQRGFAEAQQSLWGQCGGIGWAGATSCTSGSVCTEGNSYYWQCLPGTVSTMASSKTTATAKTTVTTTSSTTLKTTASASKSSSTPSSGPTGTATTKYLITFGDSYSQTGFNINSTRPAPGNILGNPSFPGYTTANGNQSNWIDNLIDVYNNGLTLSYNFASGGATTDASLVAGYEPYPTVLSLVNQVSEFTSSIPNGPWTAEDSLFGVWMGVNDVGNGWYQSNWSTLVTEILNQYFAQVQILYNTGARKFLFLTVPPIYLTPAVLASDSTSQQDEAAAVALYNSILSSKVSAFQSANSGVTTWLFDTTVPFKTAINNPAAYGAVNATCYDSTGTSCLWYNNYHPGSMIHGLVAQGIVQQIGDW